MVFYAESWQERRRNFTETEVEVRVGEVEARKILYLVVTEVGSQIKEKVVSRSMLSVL